MAFKVRRPGTIAEEPLVGFSGVVVHYLVPDGQTGAEIREVLRTLASTVVEIEDGAGENKESSLTAAEVRAHKKMFGKLFRKISGVDFDGSDEIILERDDNGELTDESYGIVTPFIISLGKLAHNVCGTGLRLEDEKNS